MNVFSRLTRAVIGLPLTAINPRTMKVERIHALADVLRSSRRLRCDIIFTSTLDEFGFRFCDLFEFLTSPNREVVEIFREGFDRRIWRILELLSQSID